MGAKQGTIQGEMNIHGAGPNFRKPGPFFIAVVAGDSMEPAFRAGDLVIGRTGGTLRCGDVIVFPAKQENTLIIHRVYGFEGETVLTRGDHNPAGITEAVPAGDVLARVVLRVQGAGKGVRKLQELAGVGSG